ncbi:MAG TPA: CHAT domain-containing protein [Kofleriaceae bacterium]|nr:CHAT domain-containing protein [Kofleriaceae bacterium]
MSHEDEPSAEEIQALVDGELSPAAAARVRSALVCSPRALAELAECMQVAALAQALRDEAVAKEREPAFARARMIRFLPGRSRFRPRTVLAMLASLSLCGAGAALVFGFYPPGKGVPDDPVLAFAGALAPNRPIEPRLSWPAADRHRPYDTARAGERAAERFSFELLGRIEKLGDPRAATAARILQNSPAPAVGGLRAEDRSPDTSSDRAAIALLERRPKDALLAAAAALESDPQHVQAAWNRALALERLGTPLIAADAFAAVASRGEPGWSQEASERAAGLRARFERRKAAWKAAGEAAAGLVAGGMVDDATVTAFPGLVRRHLYEAVRVAGSAGRVRALRPLAEAIDGRHGGRHLADHIDRVARSDFRRRGPLAARYAALVRGELTGAQTESLLRALRAAGQGDILLGALVRAGNNPERPEAPHLDEYLARARASGDPWFELKADDDAAWTALWKEEFAFTQTLLGPPAARCERGEGIAVCLDIFRLLTHAYVSLHRPDAARRTLDRSREIARATGNVTRETELLYYEMLVATMHDDTSSSLYALAAAFADEQIRQSDDCSDIHTAHEWKAMSLINQRRLDEARGELFVDTGACEGVFTSSRAFAIAHLLRESGEDAAVQALRRQIEDLRSAGASPGERAFLDHVEGRLLIDREPEAGRALLRRAITAAGALPDDIKADKARSFSYSVLVEEAGSRAASGEALDLLAEQLALPPPARCALGAAVEESATFAARAADGTTTGVRIAQRPGEPAGSHPVPAAMLAALAGCDSVDVYARQPYYGRPELLPREMIWQFRTRARPTRQPSGRQVVVANIDASPELELAPLRPVAQVPGAVLIEGPDATPERVMAAAADASFLEIHAHGLLGQDESDTSYLVLAPDTRGRYALGGAEIRRAQLRGAPVVVLAACHASAIGASFHSTWGLADAFAGAGASAIVASPDPIQDAGAPAFFAALRARISAGEAPAAALREERMARTDPTERAWFDRLVVFR